MRTRTLAAVVLIAGVVYGCASSSVPASPTPSVLGGGGGSAVSVQIVILGGSQNASFDPSPASAGPGSTVIWVNSDPGSTHRIVSTDGSFDTGVIDLESLSGPTVLKTDGAHYYCVMHPTEVGVINGANGTAPPCSGPHC
ncbi:MAG TPA: hypothetical protein VGK32_22625 [Vicinamibacterales bacterium]|jgi:plastocyanin